MKDFYTRRDIMNELGISRAIIEGYEDAGFIESVKKNEVRAKLYDHDTVIKLGFICSCRMLGFNIAEIREMLSAPSKEVRGKLLTKHWALMFQIDECNKMLDIVGGLIHSKTDDLRKNEAILEIFKEERYRNMPFKHD